MTRFMERIFGKPYPELKQGILNLKSGTSLAGVILSVRGDWVVVRNTSLLQDRGTDVKQRPALDGEVVIRLIDIDFIQVT